MRALVWAIAFALAAGPVAAQEQTLADIRQELSVLFVEIQSLRRELSTTGAVGTGIGGDTLQRLDLIERELRRLTSKTEELEFRISRVVDDGSNRVGDLEFRLCELEPACDIGSLGETPRLGGGEVVAVATTPDQPVGETQLAVSEQADFDGAVAALEQGEYAQAAELFQAFTDTYTGGPLSGEAHFLRGEARAALGETSAAARAYLTSFSGDPDGRRAADALLGLGQSLAELGQMDEACVTLSEVSARFAGSAQAGEATAELARLGCA